MLRSFIKKVKTPERADLLIGFINLLTKYNYLAMLDTLEELPALEDSIGLEGAASAIEEQTGALIESLFNAHCIQIEYRPEQIISHLDLLTFLLSFCTPEGHTPTYLSSSWEVFELGDTARDILIEIYERSGCNVTEDPLDWVLHVGIDLANNIARTIENNQFKNTLGEESNLITGKDQENFKKFAALYPDALAVKEIKEAGGQWRDVSDLIIKHSAFFEDVMKPEDLAKEIVGLCLISNTGTEGKENFTIKLIETVAGATQRAISTISAVRSIFKRVGLE